MVAKLQQKFPIGILSAQWMDFINEAFRKIDQTAKGGFIWQLRTANIVEPAGAQTAVSLPADFDPGKTAVLYGPATGSPTSTLIPYKTPQEFVNEQHFTGLGVGIFSAWTFYPNFSWAANFTAPSYLWTIKMAPDTAFPLLPGGITLRLYYHAVNLGQFISAPNSYFPTPDQFDSLILDLAEAEARREYGASGWEKLAAAATQSLNEIIDTYRTDRYDLAGVSDIVAQAQEKQAERDR